MKTYNSKLYTFCIFLLELRIYVINILAINSFPLYASIEKEKEGKAKPLLV